jgi:hypothetical protein
MIPYMCLTNGGKIQATEICSAFTVGKYLPAGQADPDNQRSDKWSSNVVAARTARKLRRGSSHSPSVLLQTVVMWQNWLVQPVARGHSACDTALCCP